MPSEVRVINCHLWCPYHYLKAIYKPSVLNSQAEDVKAIPLGNQEKRPQKSGDVIVMVPTPQSSLCAQMHMGPHWLLNKGRACFTRLGRVGLQTEPSFCHQHLPASLPV